MTSIKFIPADTTEFAEVDSIEFYANGGEWLVDIKSGCGAGHNLGKAMQEAYQNHIYQVKNHGLEEGG